MSNEYVGESQKLSVIVRQSISNKSLHGKALISSLCELNCPGCSGWHPFSCPVTLKSIQHSKPMQRHVTFEAKIGTDNPDSTISRNRGSFFPLTSVFYEYFSHVKMC